MSTIGKKRKLEETDITTDGDRPIKQQKLSNPKEEADDGDDTQTTTNGNKMENDEEKDDNKNNTIPIEEELDEETLSKLKSQLEFYFSDSNLPLDSHILNTLKTNNGFYPIANLLNFARIASMTQSIDLLIKLIEESSKLQLNDSKDGVSRHPSLPDPPTKEEILKRTIFCKGFHPRYSVDQLLNFWKQQTKSPDHVLSVRPIKPSFVVGMGGDGHPKRVKRFLGSCTVEFASIDLAEEFSKLTFNSEDRTIVCGMYEKYYTDEFEWKIKPKYYEFVPNRVLYIFNIATYSTYCDVKNWICNAIYPYGKKKNNEKKNKVEYVDKERGAGQAYARFSNETNMQKCIKLMKKKAFMGIYPQIRMLNDEQAQKIWKKVAAKKFDINKDVEINMKPRKQQKKYKNKKLNKEKENVNNDNHNKNDNDDDDNEKKKDDVDMDQDIDIQPKTETNIKNETDGVVAKEETAGNTEENKMIGNEGIDLEKIKQMGHIKSETPKNDKKHQLENAEIPDAKRQKVE